MGFAVGASVGGLTGLLFDLDKTGIGVGVLDDVSKALTPGKVAQFNIDMWSTANVLKKGHRIRLEVSSSNFPRFDRNPNTGHPLYVDAEIRPAMQTVMHDRSFASYVTLPVIPARR